MSLDIPSYILGQKSAGGHGDITTEPLLVSENGTYTAPSGTAYTPVVVDVPAQEPTLQNKTATQNGLVTPDSGYDGLSSVNVSLEIPHLPPIMPNSNLNIYSNGNQILVNGFTSSARYLIALNDNLSTLRVNWSYPFEIHLRAAFSAVSTSNDMAIIGSRNGGFYKIPSICFVSGSGSGVFAGVSSNGSTWTSALFIGPSDLTYSQNTYYDISFVYDGEKITLTVSDGVNEVIHETDASNVLSGETTDIILGGLNGSSVHYAQYVTLDLSKCYIKSNGEFVWGGP